MCALYIIFGAIDIAVILLIIVIIRDGRADRAKIAAIQQENINGTS